VFSLKCRKTKTSSFGRARKAFNLKFRHIEFGIGEDNRVIRKINLSLEVKLGFELLLFVKKK